jgi:uncharacterized lipoprotein YajG
LNTVTIQKERVINFAGPIVGLLVSLVLLATACSSQAASITAAPAQTATKSAADVPVTDQAYIIVDEYLVLYDE